MFNLGLSFSIILHLVVFMAFSVTEGTPDIAESEIITFQIISAKQRVSNPKGSSKLDGSSDKVIKPKLLVAKRNTVGDMPQRSQNDFHSRLSIQRNGKANDSGGSSLVKNHNSAIETVPLLGTHSVRSAGILKIYPPKSVILEEQGEVILQASINPGGILDDVLILKSSGHFRLDQAARVALMKSKLPKSNRNKAFKRKFSYKFTLQE